jgi:hypothetical protein
MANFGKVGSRRRPRSTPNIGVQPEQISAKAMIADYVPLLMKEASALRERLVQPHQKPF